MSKVLCIWQIVIFILLIVAYFFIATRKNCRWSKVGEVTAMYVIMFYFAFSKTITSFIFILSAIPIVIFNIKKSKE